MKAKTDPRIWAAPPPSGIRRFVPLLTWLPAYDRSWLRFDVVAGATIWGLLIPEMIAFALAELREPVIEMARRTGTLEVLGEDRVFHTVAEATAALE